MFDFLVTGQNLSNGKFPAKHHPAIHLMQGGTNDKGFGNWQTMGNPNNKQSSTIHVMYENFKFELPSTNLFHRISHHTIQSSKSLRDSSCNCRWYHQQILMDTETFRLKLTNTKSSNSRRDTTAECPELLIIRTTDPTDRIRTPHFFFTVHNPGVLLPITNSINSS